MHIGRSLRQAREGRGLDLDTAEHETRIRAKYLRALEAERFELLPGGVYTRAFLRGYAEFLGLDGDRLVDAYSARFPEPEPSLEPESSPLPRPLVSRGLKTVAVALSSVAVLGLLAWRLGSNQHGSGPMPPIAQTPHPLQQSVAKQVPRAAASIRADRPARFASARQGAPIPAPRLTIAAARGDCWLSIRLGAETGRILWEGMLFEGRSVHVAARTVWIRMGAPWNLDARLNGKPLRALPPRTGNVVVTSGGVRLLTT